MTKPISIIALSSSRAIAIDVRGAI
jgi:hypothetical protein